MNKEFEEFYAEHNPNAYSEKELNEYFVFNGKEYELSENKYGKKFDSDIRELRVLNFALKIWNYRNEQ